MWFAKSSLCLILFSFAIGGDAVTAERKVEHDIRPGAGVTGIRLLSDYLPSLKNTPGDSAVYFLEGKEKGGTIFVAGGTHGNEIAGIVAAVILVERAGLPKGRLIVLPHANNSAVTFKDAKRPGPSAITLKTPSGSRQFMYGSRLTSPEHQGMNDPERYRHPNSAEELDGSEARNLDRAYPGKANGNLTERMAYAILQIIRREEVDVAFDLHESGPESRLAWMVVANPKSLDVAARAILDLDAEGISMKLEPSSDTFRGLSHREWGDASKAHAFLFETPNPGMADGGVQADIVGDSRFPLTRRVGVHLSTLTAILNSYNETAAGRLKVMISGVPVLSQFGPAGVGAFLK